MAFIDGMDHILNGLSRGKGVILCVTHFGSWKMVLPVLGYGGHRVNQVAVDPRVFIREGEAANHNLIMKLERRSEESLPARFFYLEPGRSVRAIHRALAANEIVVIALDGVVGDKRITLPFLRRTIRLTVGSAELAHATGAAILPVFTIRQGDNRHRIAVFRPLSDQGPVTRQAFVQRYMRYFNTLFQYHVKRHPDHYARFLYTIRKYPFPGQGSIIG
jgi:lauroyl/myristoyl acyltransferase